MNQKINTEIIRPLMDLLTSFYQSKFQMIDAQKTASLHSLIQKLKINDEIVEKYRIGWADAEASEILNLCRDEDERIALDRAGIWKYQRERVELRFKNRLIIPMLDRDRAPVGFRGYTAGEVSALNPKVVGTPSTEIYNSPEFLYGEFSVELCQEVSDQVVIVHAPHMTWPLHKAGICSVSVNVNLSAAQAARIKAVSSNVIFLLSPNFYAMDLRDVRQALNAGLRVMILPAQDKVWSQSHIENTHLVEPREWFARYNVEIYGEEK